MTIPASVTTIGSSAFSLCSSLTTVTISDGVTTIGSNAFSTCQNLFSVIIPSTVTSIGAGAFTLCNNLGYIYYAGSAEQWGRIAIDADGNDALKNAIILYNSPAQPDVTAPAAVFTTDNPNSTSSNSHNNRFGGSVKSYLYENGQGGLTRVEQLNHNGSNVVYVEEYDSNFKYLRNTTIPMELATWGGFYAGEEYNFVIFGQYNGDEDDHREVIRVVKYSRDWRRLGQASLYGANTISPFIGGSLRCDEYEGTLFVRTCHMMYAHTDGINHQANLSMAVRESDMVLTEAYYNVSSSIRGYVSHSFDQFVIIDREGRYVALDHGDAYPRAAVLTISPANGAGRYSTNVSIKEFPGAIGNNYTGAHLGGLEETHDGYAVAYNFIDNLIGGTVRKVYLAYVDKDSLEVTTTVVSEEGNTAPVLVSTGLDGGYILWNTDDYRSDTLYYAAYSNGGAVGEVRTAAVEAPLSDCKPVLYNGKVVWYTTNGSLPTFYLLDENGVTAIPFSKASAGPTQPEAPKTSFTDLAAGAYYTDAVAWAVENKITTGLNSTTFGPNEPCTREQVVTFLWRAYGEKEPASTTTPFTDVKPGDYFYKAVLWAVENGITSGTSGTTFSPNDPCTRAQAVTFQYRAAGKPAAFGGSAFNDVPKGAYYAEAVAWAVENKITSGLSSAAFGPDTTCTRGQIVTFLYRELA